MKRTLRILVSLAGMIVLAQPLWAATFSFNDTFGTSSLNSTTPTAPTSTNTSYQMIASKAWNTGYGLASGHLKFGIVATGAGSGELQALFAASPVTLVYDGEYIRTVITFSNEAGILTQAGTFGFGMYASGGVQPIAGGLNNRATTSYTDYATGGAQYWKGYWAGIAYGSANSAFYERQAQTLPTATANNNQDVITVGSSSQSYRNPAASTVAAGTSAPSVVLSNAVYTEVLTYTLSGGALILESKLYYGTDTTGSPLSSMTATTSTSPQTTAFDALAIGWRVTGNVATMMDVYSIDVSAEYTVVTTPPSIDTQPVSMAAPLGSLGYFTVGASGINLTYQWHRGGTNLADVGNIKGSKSPTLVISPVTSADLLNNYYVTVFGAGGFSTNSVNVALSQRTAKNLTWVGNSSLWDLGVSANWNDGASTVAFSQGDNVTFDDSNTSGYLGVDVTGNYLSPGTVTVNTTANIYQLQSSGSIAGPARMNIIGPGRFILNNVNTYTGGTLISNETAIVVLNNQNGLGNGPVTLAKAGGQINCTAGNSSMGINGDVILTDDFTINAYSGSYGTVFNGNVSGTAGKTLTITPYLAGTTSRIRFNGTNVASVINLNLAGPDVQIAPYGAGGVYQTFSGVITGPGNLIQRGGGTTILTGANDFSGGATPTTGTIGFGRDTDAGFTSGPIGTGPLMVAPEAPNTSGSGTVLAWGGARTIANPIQYNSATNNQTLIFGGTNALTFTGLVTLNGNDFTGTINRIFQANNTNALTTLAGAISDNGLACGFTKTGAGVLALNATETYTGPTLVSAGTLQVNGSLDPASAVTVSSNATLAGTGAIGGAVTVTNTGVIAPGTATSIGTLTINGNLSFAGNLQVNVDKAAVPTSDKVQLAAGSSVINTGAGTITVTNIGAAALQANDTFTLFSKAVPGGATMTVTGGGQYVTWTNKLAVDGTIAVLSVLPSMPTNISYSYSGGTLTLSWPASYTGYLLQSNSVGVTASSGWYDIPNSGNSAAYPVTIEAGKPNVFYRLRHP